MGVVPPGVVKEDEDLACSSDAEIARFVCCRSDLARDMIMIANPLGLVRAQLLLADVTLCLVGEIVVESIIPLFVKVELDFLLLITAPTPR